MSPSTQASIGWPLEFLDGRKAVREEIKRLALFGSGVAELTRNRAEQMVKDLVKGGDVRREQASGLVKELLDRNRQARKELGRFVRAEIENQIQKSGLASRRDIDRLERRVARLETSTKSSAKTTASKTTAKTTTRQST